MTGLGGELAVRFGRRKLTFAGLPTAGSFFGEFRLLTSESPLKRSCGYKKMKRLSTI
jgi:hypothetical protein